MSITFCNDLALNAQHGDQSAVLALWELVKGTASTVVRKYPCTASVSTDDLLQQAFLAMLEAVTDYDAERGDFKTLFIYHVKKACGSALGLRRRHVEEAYSLDMPISNDEDRTILDLIADDTLISAQDKVEQQDLHAALQAALEALPEKWRAPLIEHEVQGRTYDAIGRRLGCSQQNAQRLRDCAVARLRKDERIARFYRAA